MKVKALKYTDLMEDCKDRGWCAWLFPVEVCSLKFQAESLWKLLTRLGILGRACRTAIRESGRGRGHPVGYGTVEMICAESLDP